MISDQAVGKAQECADAVAMVLKGEVPRKMMRLLGLFLVAGVILAACGGSQDEPGPAPSEQQVDGSGTVTPPASASTPPSTRSATRTPSVSVASCAELLKRGWMPPLEEAPDVAWDPATGIATITFSGEQLVLDIGSDDRCQDLPVLGRMIRTALAGEAES